MSDPTGPKSPAPFFGMGVTHTFINSVVLPTDVYDYAEAGTLVMAGFRAQLKAGNEALIAIAKIEGVDVTKLIASIGKAIDTKFKKEAAWVATFVNQVNITFSLNVADNGKSYAVDVLIASGPTQAVHRSFFRSIVKAVSGQLIGGLPDYGNATEPGSISFN